MHNLVHCELLEPNGVTFRSRRLDDEQQSEFLASTDNWFRPTQLRVGPDGALWIADMYRLVIEHPQWIPQEWQEKLNVRAGDDKGRLWRVAPIGSKPKSPPRLDKLSDLELASAMNTPNRWQRDMVQQLLFERLASIPAAQKQPGCFDALTALIKDSKHPEARVQALHTLAILNALTAENITTALKDPHPGVRAAAVRLAERMAKENVAVQRQLLAPVVADPHPWVQVQLAATLGELPGKEAAIALSHMLMYAEDPYVRAMAHSSIHAKNLPLMVFGLLFMPPPDVVKNGHPLLEPLLTCAVAGDDLDALEMMAGFLLRAPPAKTEPWRWALIDTWLKVQRRGNTSWADWLAAAEAKQPDLAESWTEWLSALRPLIDDTAMDPARRAIAMRLYGQTSKNPEFSTDWLKPSQPVEVQRAAIEFAGRMPTMVTAMHIVARWPKLSPGLRLTAREQLLGRAPVAAALLKAVATNELTPAGIDPETEQFLRSHRDEKIRQEAERVLKRTDTANRAEVVANSLRTMPNAGDATAGRELFAKRCAQCHKLGEIGHAVGPDLASLTDKSVNAIVTAVLDPNRAVETKFLQFNAVTHSGQTVAGLISAESATSITLLAAEAKTTTLLRTEIDELVAVNKSLMPEGLEKELSPAALADLVTFIRGNVPLPARKTFPGNEPKRLAASDKGEFVLTPATCEIYGPTIVLEEKHGNLGWWSSAEDFVVWTIDVPASGKYRVEMEWACDSAAAGHRVRLEAGGASLTHQVQATAGWDDYRRADIGTLDMEAGPRRITLRPTARPLPALMDFKSLTLTPR